MPAGGPMVGAVQGLAEDVVLVLLAGGVAPAHRRRGPVALQLRVDPLLGRDSAVHVVQYRRSQLRVPPIASGSDEVGAATMAPLARWSQSFSVMAERRASGSRRRVYWKQSASPRHAARTQGEGVGDLHRAVELRSSVTRTALPPRTTGAVQQRLGRDGEGTAGDAVEQAAEPRRAVEAGDAEPAHRAVPADQGRGGAVPDQAPMRCHQDKQPPSRTPRGRQRRFCPTARLLTIFSPIAAWAHTCGEM